jgi:beta-lactamase class D
MVALLFTAVPTRAQDLAAHFAGIQGTFVLLNSQTGQYVRHDPVRATQRFPPCSTFKIPNTAILLETGVARDQNYTLK